MSARQQQITYLKGYRAPRVDGRTGRMTDQALLPVASSEDVVSVETGNPVTIGPNNNGARCATLQFARSSQAATLYAYVRQNSANANFWFNARTRGIAALGPGAIPVVVGGLVPRGLLVAGHEGLSEILRFTTLPGAMTKVPYNGSAFNFAPIAVPKYFPSTQVGGLKRYGIYTKNANGSTTIKELTSRLWNMLDQKLIGYAYAYLLDSDPATYGFLADAFDDAKSAQAGAHFANAPTSSTNEQQPAMVFYGTLYPGELGATRTRCPIAYNATSVKLVGGSTIAGTRLQMTQIYSPGTYDPATVNVSIGPQPSNLVMPLSTSDAGYIEVSSPDVTIGQALEIPFELHYYLGV